MFSYGGLCGKTKCFWVQHGSPVATDATFTSAPNSQHLPLTPKTLLFESFWQLHTLEPFSTLPPALVPYTAHPLAWNTQWLTMVLPITTTVKDQWILQLFNMKSFTQVLSSVPYSKISTNACNQPCHKQQYQHTTQWMTPLLPCTTTIVDLWISCHPMRDPADHDQLSIPLCLPDCITQHHYWWLQWL